MPNYIKPLECKTIHDPHMHRPSLCQRCIELGYNCRNYVYTTPSTNQTTTCKDDISMASSGFVDDHGAPPMHDDSVMFTNSDDDLYLTPPEAQ